MDSFIALPGQPLRPHSTFPWQASAAATPQQIADFTALSGVSPTNLRVCSLVCDVSDDDPVLADLQAKWDADSDADPRPLRDFTLYQPAGIAYPESPSANMIRGFASSETLIYRFAAEPRFGLTRLTLTLLVSDMLDDVHPVPTLTDLVEIITSRDPGSGRGIYDDGDKKWFRFSVRLPPEMSGNVTDGWTDPTGRIHVIIQQSQYMQTWANDMCRPVAGSTPITLEDGTVCYLCESLQPVDVRAKKFDVVFEHFKSASYIDYQRDRDITGIYSMGTLISLPAYPYSIPSDISALVADLETAGFPGATVTTTATRWTLTIPDVVAYDYSYRMTLTIDPPQESRNQLGETIWITNLQCHLQNLRIDAGFGESYDRPSGQFFRARITLD